MDKQAVQAQGSNTNKTSANMQVLLSFTKAFNEQNLAAMRECVTDQASWLSVDGGTIKPQTQGAESLVSTMSAYFESCPSCRSSLHHMIESKERISALEIASWQSASGPKRQASMVVYEFQAGKIDNVYYFPEESAP